MSVNRDARTFRLHDTERGTKRIKVNSRTRYERVNGVAGLHKGQRRIEVKVRRRNGRWIAIEVEKSGGGGEHGGGLEREDVEGHDALGVRGHLHLAQDVLDGAGLDHGERGAVGDSGEHAESQRAGCGGGLDHLDDSQARGEGDGLRCDAP